MAGSSVTIYEDLMNCKDLKIDIVASHFHKNDYYLKVKKISYDFFKETVINIGSRGVLTLLDHLQEIKQYVIGDHLSDI